MFFVAVKFSASKTSPTALCNLSKFYHYSIHSIHHSPPRPRANVTTDEAQSFPYIPTAFFVDGVLCHALVEWFETWKDVTCDLVFCFSLPKKRKKEWLIAK